MEFTEERKKELEREIVDMAIGALERGAITEDQLGDMSTFVLSRIDRLQTEDDLKDFLKSLSEKWKFYEPLYKKLLGDEQGKKDEKTVHQAEDLIKTGNIDGALQVMKGAQ